MKFVELCVSMALLVKTCIHNFDCYGYKFVNTQHWYLTLFNLFLTICSLPLLRPYKFEFE